MPACGIELASQLTEDLQWPALRARSDNGIQVVDLFSGCGGLSAGFAAGGFRIVGAAEIDRASAETYERNLGVAPAIVDLANVAESQALTQDLMRQFGIDPTAPLVVVGGPPCQGFTSHTKRNKNDGDMRNSLVRSFAVIAARMKADVIVLENVPELLSSKHWHHYISFKSHLEDRGYRVTAEIHNLATFGVPQERFRATVVAVRNGEPPMPRSILDADRFRTVRDAIGGLPAVEPGQLNSVDPQHFSADHRQSTIDVIRRVPLNGGSRPRGVGPTSLDKVDGFRDVYGRLAWDRPANTITRYARNPASGRYVHPDQHRGLTVREAALLQSFPSFFEFAGSFDARFSQIGNAVPPLYAAHIAGAVMDYLLGCSRTHTVAGSHRFLRVVTPTADSFSSGLISMKAKVSR